MKSWNKVLLVTVIGLLLASCDDASKANSAPDKASATQMQDGTTAEESKNSIGEQPQETDGANDPIDKPVSP
jgi:hypothetical protein